MSKRHPGIAGIVEILLVAIVLAALGFVGWRIYQAREEAADPAAPAPAASQPCEGEWYDSHTHLDDMEFSQDLAKQMKAQHVGCSVMFAHVDINDQQISMLEAREEFSPNPGRFTILADVVGDDPRQTTTAKLTQLFKDYPDVIDGFGEFGFYRPPLQGTRLTDAPWPDIFEFANERELFIMVHLVPGMESQLETMLTRYPKAKVLLHHKELGAAKIAQLLKEHDNFYYTLDTTNLLTVPATGSGGFDEVLTFPQQGGAKEFLARYAQVKDQLLTSTVKTWLPVIEAAPDRVMWGTDVALDWHLEPKAYAALLEFSEAFVAKLPAELRAGYQFDNALKAFGPGVTLQEPTEAEFDKLDEVTGNDEAD